MSENVLLINYEYCSGCHSCEFACRNEHDIAEGNWGVTIMENGPWQLPDGTWHWDYIPLPTEICDLCETRTSRGLDPSCVLHCQAKVMRFGPAEEMAKLMDGMGRKVMIVKP